MKVKHGEIEWQCGSCPKRFLRKDSFLRHHKKQHLKKRKPLSPLLRRTKTLIDDMLARQKIGQLSEIEENRLKNLYRDNLSIVVVNNIEGRCIKNIRLSLRQGDLPSMFFFAFGIDPLISYL